MGKQHTVNGFTIVELLIVVVVIAILATITIVSYRSVQNQAYDASIQKDLIDVYKAIESDRLTNGTDTYVVSSVTDVNTLLQSKGVKISTSPYGNGANNFLYCRSGDGKEFGLAARSKSYNAFRISSSTGAVRSYDVQWTSTAATTCDQVLSPAGMTGYNPLWGFSNGAWRYGV
jgi:prepilin-type N-terminal cleavage/methylation domain-containing protein